jgi:hypothetical protein
MELAGVFSLQQHEIIMIMHFDLLPFFMTSVMVLPIFVWCWILVAVMLFFLPIHKSYRLPLSSQHRMARILQEKSEQIFKRLEEVEEEARFNKAGKLIFSWH